MPVVEAREFLKRMKSAAAAQRRRFVLCLVIRYKVYASEIESSRHICHNLSQVLVLLSLLVFASNQLFVVRFSITLQRSSDCVDCGACQTVEQHMWTWYVKFASFVVFL